MDNITDKEYSNLIARTNLKLILKSIVLFLGFLLATLGTYTVFFVAAPLAKGANAESNPNDVLIVHTDNYRLGPSDIYPIGGLRWGSNLFRIENKSNEFIDTTFSLKLENKFCVDDLAGRVEVESNGFDIFLTSNTTSNIFIPVNISPHSSEVIDVSILKESCLFKSDTDIPIAIHGWKFNAN